MRTPGKLIGALFCFWLSCEALWHDLGGLLTGQIATYGKGQRGIALLQAAPFDFWFNFYCWLAVGICMLVFGLSLKRQYEQQV